MTKKSDAPAIRFKGFSDAWEQRKAIDIADYSKGNGYSKGDLTDAGTPIILYGRLYTKYQFAISEVDTFAFPRNGAVYSQGNEVIVPASGETAEDIARASAVEKSGVLLGGDLNILRPFDFINPLFLALAISNGEPQKELAKKAQGKSVVHIHNTDIQEVTIAYPSRTEQDRIVSVFRQLDHLITLHQRKFEKLTNVKKSMLEKMFPQNGSSYPEIRFKGFTDPWEQRKVQDVADRFDNLRIPVAANLRVHGTTPYYGANGIQDYVEGFTHDGEFVLVAEDGANDLKNYPVKCVNGRIWVNNHAHVLQGKAGISDNSFLAFAISQSDIESLLVGGSRAKLNAETLMSIEFKLPCLQEQYRIGEYLTQLDHLITLHQRKCANLCSPSQVVFSLLFATSTFSWEQRKLGDIADIVGGGTPSTGNQSYWDGDIDWYAPAEIADQIYANSSQKKITGLGYENSSAKMLPPGTVLFTSRAGIGKTAILTRKGCTNQGFQSIVPHRGELDSYFIFSRTGELKRYGELVGAGSTFVEVSGKQMAVMELMMPPTMREQQTIGGFFQQLDHLITLHQRELEKLQNIKKSMLEKMFV